ncbi:hypothetical protein DFH28DRAFT_874672, partial [Melampsora americana]
MSDYKSSPYSPIRQSQAGSNQPKKRNHPFIISGIFDVLVKLEAVDNNQFGTRVYQTAISTLNDDSPEIVEWVINANGYVGPETQLKAGHSYYLKGRLLAFNTKETQTFYFEADRRVLVNTSDALPGGLANTISVTGAGLIISRSVETVSPGKDNVTIVVKHSDYNPNTRLQETFEVQYRCFWSKLMEKLQVLLVPSREVVLTGHISGWIPSTHTWIVDLTGVNIMSGPENNYNPSGNLPMPSLTTPGGRSRGKIAFTGTSLGTSEPTPEPTETPETSTINVTTPRGRGGASAKASPTPSSLTDASPMASTSKVKGKPMPRSPIARLPAKRAKVVPQKQN